MELSYVALGVDMCQTNINSLLDQSFMTRPVSLMLGGGVNNKCCSYLNL